MAKNNNLVSITKNLAKGGIATVVGSSVAAGMTRYVTFVRAAQDRIVGSALPGSKIYLAETLSATKTSYSTPTLASALQKMVIIIPSAMTADKDYQSTPRIDTENPLFSIAESKFLATLLVSAAGASGPVNLFIQYYDE